MTVIRIDGLDAVRFHGDRVVGVDEINGLESVKADSCLQGVLLIYLQVRCIEYLLDVRDDFAPWQPVGLLKRPDKFGNNQRGRVKGFLALYRLLNSVSHLLAFAGSSQVR